MIIKPKRVAPFDLTLENAKENTRIVLALTNLKNDAGWIFLTQVFAENKRVLAEMIIKKQDIDGKPLTEEQTDEARYKHNYLEELMNKPDFYIKKLSPHNDPQDDLDPYDKGKQSEG